MSRHTPQTTLLSMKTILTSAAVAIGMLPAAALTVEDFCDIRTASPATVKEMTPMPDGESYAAVNDDESAIEIFSYKTGKKTGTLFSISGVKGDVKISSFEGFRISDDGRKVLLWNDSQQIYRHSFTAEYYVYDVARQTLARVSENGPQRGATLSHDGRMVAYTRHNNIYISNLDYRTDRAITTDGKVNSVIYGTPDWGYEEEFSVINTMRWSADDHPLAYVRFDETAVPAYSFDAYRGYCDPDPEGDLYPDRYTYKYPLAGYPNSIVSVHAYDLNNRTEKKMDLPISDTDYVPSLEFDGKGLDLMVMLLNRDQNHLRLFKVNPASTVAHEIVAFKSDAWLNPAAYQMVRYYDKFFVIGNEDSGWRHLCQYDYNGNLQRRLTSGDFNVTAYYGYDSRKAIHYMQTTSLGAVNRSVAAVSAKGGSLKLLTGQAGWESAAWSADFSYWLRSWSDVTTPPRYTIHTADGTRRLDVELNTAYAAKYASAPKMEITTAPNAEGKEMNAYIIRPGDFSADKKYPVLMYQYNGPDSQEVQNRWRMEGIFYLASRGYIVCAVDGRGTGNRERSWATAVYKDLGHYEVLDQIAGARYFSSLPYADASRLACFGWSYGGYMTLMLLQAENSPYCKGVSMAPVTDWRYYDSIYTERYMLTPSQNPKGYESSSALRRTEHLNVPLLIMSGTSDDNVHIYNTLKYTSKLTSDGKLFDMMAYTAFEHSLRMCNARVQLFRKVAEFLER